MKQLALLLILTMTLFTASCANQDNNAQSGIGLGALGGALAGQAIGHNTEATLIGAAVGTMLGYIIGNEMDKADRQQLNQVYERGVSGQKTPGRTRTPAMPTKSLQSLPTSSPRPSVPVARPRSSPSSMVNPSALTPRPVATTMASGCSRINWHPLSQLQPSPRGY